MSSRKCRFAAVGAIAVLALPVQASEPVTQALDLGALAIPGTLNLGHAFNDLASATPGIQIVTAGTPITLTTADRFHDHYAFSVDAALASFITLTIDLGTVFNIDGLVMSLYAGPAARSGTVGLTSGLSGLVPVATSSTGSGPALGEYQVISATPLLAGSYVLDVSGLISGSFGGSYAGVINLSPVPEPATGSLSLLGLVALAAATRRRWSHHLSSGLHLAQHAPR